MPVRGGGPRPEGAASPGVVSAPRRWLLWQRPSARARNAVSAFVSLSFIRLSPTAPCPHLAMTEAAAGSCESTFLSAFLVCRLLVLSAEGVWCRLPSVSQIFALMGT